MHTIIHTVRMYNAWRKVRKQTKGGVFAQSYSFENFRTTKPENNSFHEFTAHFLLILCVLKRNYFERKRSSNDEKSKFFLFQKCDMFVHSLTSQHVEFAFL